MSLLAAVLVLAVIGACLFIWYSGNVRGSMFAGRNGQLTEAVQPVQTAAPEPEKTEILPDADWIDEEGNA